MNAILTNFSWITGLRVLRYAGALLVSICVARSLGPSHFGHLSLALAITTIVSVFTRLGLEGPVKRELISEPDSSNEILGTAFALKAIGACVGYIGLLVYVYSFSPTPANRLLLIVGAQLFLEVFLIVDFWFQSKLEAKYPQAVLTSAFLVSGAVRVWIALKAPNLIAIAATYSLYALLGIFGLTVLYVRKSNSFARWSFSLRRAKGLLSVSWPVIFNGITAILYTKTDMLMISYYCSAADLGRYSAAGRIIDALTVLPVAVGASLLPSIIQSRRSQHERRYRALLLRYFRINTFLAYGAGLPLALGAPVLVPFLFGAEYQESALLLQCLSIGICLRFLIYARGQVFLVEDLLRMSLIASLIGLGSNVMINLILIPRYGPMGAAVATLISLTITLFTIFLFPSSFRWIGKLLAKSLFTPSPFLPEQPDIDT